MSSFLGTYNISLDDKGRFNVPAKFRGTLEQSGPQLVVCAMTPFLVVFPHKEWAENENKYPGQSWKHSFESLFDMTLDDFYRDFDAFMLQDKASQMAILKTNEEMRNAKLMP